MEYEIVFNKSKEYLFNNCVIITSITSDNICSLWLHKIFNFIKYLISFSLILKQNCSWKLKYVKETFSFNLVFMNITL